MNTMICRWPSADSLKKHGQLSKALNCYMLWYGHLPMIYLSISWQPLLVCCLFLTVKYMNMCSLMYTAWPKCRLFFLSNKCIKSLKRLIRLIIGQGRVKKFGVSGEKCQFGCAQKLCSNFRFCHLNELAAEGSQIADSWLITNTHLGTL